MMTQIWKTMVDGSFYSGTLPADLSKAFHSIKHELLITKLNAQRLQSNTLELILVTEYNREN